MKKDDYIYRGVGVRWDSHLSESEMLQKAGLNWDVQTSATRYVSLAGEMETKGIWLAYRNDTGEELSAVSPDWKPYQNSRFIKDFINFCQQTGMKPERLGFLPKQINNLRGTNKVFATAIIPDEVGGVLKLDDKDILQSRLIYSNDHCYGNGVSAAIYVVRLICTNGAMATEEAAKTRVLKHIGSHINESGKEPQKLMQELHWGLLQYGGIMKILAEKQVSPEEALKQLIKLYKGKEGKGYEGQSINIKTIHSIFMGEMDNSFEEYGIDLGQNISTARNTAYGLVQAVSAYRNHFTGSHSTNQSQLLSLWQGDSNRQINQMFDSMKRAYVPQRVIDEMRALHQKQAVSVGF